MTLDSAQIGLVEADHAILPGRAHFLSLADKKMISIANLSVLACRLTSETTGYDCGGMNDLVGTFTIAMHYPDGVTSPPS